MNRADCADQDAADFEAQLRSHALVAARVAARHVNAASVQDALQNAYLAAWLYRASFNPSRGSFRSWLLTIVTHESQRLERLEVRRAWLTARVGEEESRRPALVDQGVSVAAALDCLTARQQEVVGLHYFADLSVADVAKALGVSVGTVKSTLFDARQRMRAAIAEGVRDE